MGVVLIFSLAGAALAATVFSIQRARLAARTRAMEQLAPELGLSFTAEDRFGLLQQLKGFDLFRRARSWFRRAGMVRNVLRGQVDGTEVALFDYTYVVSTGKSSRRITQTVFFANSKDWYLPNFRLRPETWWQKIRALVDKSDIDFPDSPEFSDKFWITGAFESLVRKTFSPELQQFLCERPPVHLEGNNYYLLAYKPKRALNAAEAKVFFDNCCELVRRFKREQQPELLNLAELRPPEMPLTLPETPEQTAL